MPTPDPLVSPDWLAARLGSVKLLDATYFMPADAEKARQVFLESHIPGARLFEVDRVADPSSGLPHMMPDAASLAEELGRLGIEAADTVVVYDRSGNHFSAPRVWKTLRAFGHEHVHVLDGGLNAWRAGGHPLESGEAAGGVAVYRPARAVADGVVDLEQVRALSLAGRQSGQLLDARSAGRFAGTTPEPRPGLRSGHMPNALNLPFDYLTTEDGAFADTDLIRKLLHESGVDLKKPVVTTCGSGLTACVLALALARIGIDAVIYDGSWMEWGGRQDTPVALD